MVATFNEGHVIQTGAAKGSGDAQHIAKRDRNLPKSGGLPIVSNAIQNVPIHEFSATAVDDDKTMRFDLIKQHPQPDLVQEGRIFPETDEIVVFIPSQRNARMEVGFDDEDQAHHRTDQNPLEEVIDQYRKDGHQKRNELISPPMPHGDD